MPFAQVGAGLVPRVRRGVRHGNRTKDTWYLFPTMTSKKEEASDHAAIYADPTDF
jgi:hypothetical protein